MEKLFSDKIPHLVNLVLTLVRYRNFRELIHCYFGPPFREEMTDCFVYYFLDLEDVFCPLTQRSQRVTGGGNKIMLTES